MGHPKKKYDSLILRRIKEYFLLLCIEKNQMFIIHKEESYFVRPKLDEAFLLDTEGVL